MRKILAALSAAALSAVMLGALVVPLMYYHG
jgi:hypothetical protein